MCMDAPEDVPRCIQTLSQFCKSTSPVSEDTSRFYPKHERYPPPTHTSGVSWVLPAEAPDILNQKQAFLFLLCPIHVPDTKNPWVFLCVCVFFFLSTLLSFGVVDETVTGNWNHMSNKRGNKPTGYGAHTWNMILSFGWHITKDKRKQAYSEENKKNVSLWGRAKRLGDIQTRKENRVYMLIALNYLKSHHK